MKLKRVNEVKWEVIESWRRGSNWSSPTTTDDHIYELQLGIEIKETTLFQSLLLI